MSARSNERGRTTIAAIMALIAASALMIASTIERDSVANDLLVLLLLFFLPLYFLTNLWRTRSAAEMVTASLAIAYLAWGASFRFRPGEPPGKWTAFDAIRRVYWGMGFRFGWRWTQFPQHSDQSVRWNWGLLAAFYAAILLVSAVNRVQQRPGRVGLGGSRAMPEMSRRGRVWFGRIPATAELVVALWFLGNWHHGSCPVPSWPYGSCPFQSPWCEWTSLLGFVGWLILALVDWRPRPRSWRPLRFVARAARLVPAAIAGLIIGVVYSLFGWEAAACTAAVFSVILGLSACVPMRRRRPRVLALLLVLLLAMFWGFAFSVEIADLKPVVLDWATTH